LWSFRIGNELFSSFGTGYNRIFVNSNNEMICALDEFVGNKIWEFAIMSDGEQLHQKYHLYSSPAVADGKVFVGSVDGNFYVLDAETGKLLWKYKTGGPIYSSPAISDGKVFIASTDGKLYAFGIDPETYYNKAEKYFSEKQYERAKEFYLKAKNYYSTEGNIEMINEAEGKIIIADQKIIEDKPRQEDLAKANNFMEKGSFYLSKRKFRDAVTSFKEAKNIYEKYEEMYKMRLCEDRISYSEKRVMEETRIGFLILGGILLIFIVGIFLIKRWKKKDAT
jgi:hypothetical protein